MRRLRDELGADTKVLATGGLARALVPSVQETIDEVDDLLTLLGLRLIWERNVSRLTLARQATATIPGTGTSGVRATIEAMIRKASRRRSWAVLGRGLVEVVEQVADHGEHRRVVDLVGHVAGQPGQREHLGPGLVAAHRRDRAEHQERRHAVQQHVRGLLALADRRPDRQPAARRRRSAATGPRRCERICSSLSPTCSAIRSWNTLDIAVAP